MANKHMSMRRGYLYTVGIILLMIPLILLIVFYTGVSKTTIENTVAGVRCDELYYFVQDIESDMSRAMLISGRRAAIYAIDDVVTKGQPLANYTYNNTNCPGFKDFVYPRTGSEAAIAELVLCGTLYGKNVTYMSAHTLPVWLGKINNGSRGLNYEVNLTVNNFTIAMPDAWHFVIILDTNMTVHDMTGLCYYLDTNFTITGVTDIIGLEDALYPLNTNNRVKKYIYDCPLSIVIDNVAGCSNQEHCDPSDCEPSECGKDNCGGGRAAGNVVFYSNIPDLANFCSTTPDINDLVLVVDTGFGSPPSQLECDRCFNISSDYHFAAAIQYANPINSFLNCNISIPWIKETGKIDNETNYGHENQRVCGTSNISTNTCVLIKNLGDCGIHDVLIGYNSSDLNTTCYTVSNITAYSPGCPGENYTNGPSFFDRLDGRLNLSDKYVNQSVRYFNNPYIGLETIVSLPNELYPRDVTVDGNATWIDYLYWQGKGGCPVGVICQNGAYDFRLDCPHAYYYHLSTDCGGTGSVDASSESPVSEITSPPDQSYFTGCPQINITGNASDCDGTISSVDLLINGVKYNTTWDGSEWNKTFTPPTTNMYVLQSRAVDNSGVQETGLGKVTVFVSGCVAGDSTPPSTPSLKGPCGETDLPTSVTLDWDAAYDYSGIYRYGVEFNRTSNPQTSDLYYSFGTTYEKTDLGNNKDYMWRVRAQDNAGNWGNWSSACTFST